MPDAFLIEYGIFLLPPSLSLSSLSLSKLFDDDNMQSYRYSFWARYTIYDVEKG
jgi:hypothetical protein